MLHKNATINIAYHFLAEGMIVFLLVLPFTYGEYQQVPYWGYLGMILGIGVIYSIYTANEKGYGWYILTAPVFMMLFFVMNYPLYLSIGFPILLTYRYIYLRKETFPNNETTYLNVTVALAVALLIWIKDIELIAYPFLLLSLLLSGNILSHLYVLEKEEQRGIKKQLWITFGSVIGIGAISVIFIFSIRDVFNKIWYGIMSVPGYIAGKFGSLIHYFFPEPTVIEGFSWENLFGTGELGRNFKERLPEDKDTADIMDYAHLIYWIMGLVILGIIVIIAIRYFRNRFNPIVATNRHVLTENEAMGGQATPKHSFFSNPFKKPDHKVRKLVYQFERTAQKARVGRYPYETLDGWMKRLGYNMDMSTYKKVRYGGMEKVSEEEMHLLKENLQIIMKKLKNHSE